MIFDSRVRYSWVILLYSLDGSHLEIVLVRVVVSTSSQSPHTSGLAAFWVFLSVCAASGLDCIQ